MKIKFWLMAKEYLILTKLQCHDNSSTNRRKHCSNEVNISHSGFVVVVVVVFKCLFFWEIKSMHVQGRGRERRKRENTTQALSCQQRARQRSLTQDSNSPTVRWWWPELKSRVGHLTNTATQAPLSFCLDLWGVKMIMVRPCWDNMWNNLCLSTRHCFSSVLLEAICKKQSHWKCCTLAKICSSYYLPFVYGTRKVL